MNLVNLNTMELMHGHYQDDPSVDFRANFAYFRGQGTEDSSVVYIELEPGKALGQHTDSPEELLLVLEGEVEFTAGEDRVRATKGMIGVVPPMVPHGIRNVGQGIAKIVGFFPSPGVIANFTQPVQPLNISEMVFGEPAELATTV
jgi:quercetin dioxygenase-like cupin family protein